MQTFGGGKLGWISHQKLLASKGFGKFLFALFMSQAIVKIWMVKFDEPPVILQIYQGFSLPNTAKWYVKYRDILHYLTL